MKKILALVLAVMMLATIAFAAGPATRVPGNKIKMKINADGTLTDTATANIVTIDNDVAAKFWNDTVELSAKNLSVTNIKWTKGSDLVKSITINSDDELVVELKQNYTLVADKKTVVGTFKITQKGKNVTNTYKIGDTGNELTVGYKQGYVAIQADGSVVWADTYKPADQDGVGTGAAAKLVAPADDAYVFTVKPVPATDAADINNAFFGATDVAKGVTYTTLNFDAANDTSVEVKVYDGDKLFLGNDDAPDIDLVKAVNEDADLRFVNFLAEPTFSSSAILYFYGAEEDEFIYKIVNGKPVASGAKWSDDDGCWTLRARTLGSYVISDMKLSAVSVDDATTNPDTGASDVVGIATAMAAIVMVSAAAVSLKK